MSLPRIFVSSPLAFGQKIVLDLSSSHRVLQVLRLRLNDRLLLFNNTRQEFSATLIAAIKHQATLCIGKSVVRANESPLAIHLGQGISRGEKMDFTIQKAVELGVFAVTPLFTEHCNVKLKNERLEKRLQHWQQVAISAAEQSGRCYVPLVLPPQNLATWCGSTIGLRLLLDPRATTKLSGIAPVVRPSNVAILVGPEGGLSDEEVALTTQQGFLPIALGPRILRTETAALTIISLLQAQWGDF